eukprot:TRINITY_DN6187_c0_g1_i1.p1 TRINITY_DN6187_c0_g1~~TRINITY_DN6187_c0_g1_i1.p1  ORF type:complete len:351 (+),score=45.89 TRINITY_DN6187_c0_g1_i1:157-1209(+)
MKEFIDKIVKKFNSFKAFSRAAVILTLLFSLCIILIEVFGSFTDGGKCWSLYESVAACSSNFLVNKKLMVLTSVFFFTFASLDGLFNDNIYELYSAFVITLLIVAFSVFRFLEPYANDFFDWSLMLVSIGFQIFFVILAYFLYHEYRWTLYWKVGAQKSILNIYKQYILFLCILKLYVMFLLINAMTSGTGFLNENIIFTGIDIIEYILVLSLFALGYFGAKLEKRGLIYTFLALCFLPGVYVIYTFLYNIWEFSINVTYESLSLTVLTTISGLISCSLMLVVFILAINVLANFDKGLRDVKFVETEPEEGVSIPFDNVGELDYVQFEDDESDDYDIMDVFRNTTATRKK